MGLPFVLTQLVITCHEMYRIVRNKVNAAQINRAVIVLTYVHVNFWNDYFNSKQIEIISDRAALNCYYQIQV